MGRSQAGARASGSQRAGIAAVVLLGVGVLSWWLAPAEGVAEIERPSPTILAGAEDPSGGIDEVVEDSVARLGGGTADGDRRDRDPVTRSGPLPDPIAPIEHRRGLPAIALGADGSSVTARVVDAAGRPVADALIEVNPTFHARPYLNAVAWGPDGEAKHAQSADPVRTGAAGRFAVRARSPSADWNGALVRVMAAGHPPAWCRLSPFGEGEVVLDAGVPLRGRLLWHDGEPAAELEIHARADDLRRGPADTEDWIAPETVTDAEGGFTLLLPDDTGSLQLEFTHPLAKHGVDVPLDAWRADPAGHLFVHRLPPGLSVGVRWEGETGGLRRLGGTAALVLEPVAEPEAEPGESDVDAGGGMAPRKPGKAPRPVPENKRRVYVQALDPAEPVVFEQLPQRLVGQTLRLVVKTYPGEVELEPGFVATAGHHEFVYPVPAPPAEAVRWPLEVRLVEAPGQPLDADAARAIQQPFALPEFHARHDGGVQQARLDADAGSVVVWDDWTLPVVVTQPVGGTTLTATVRDADVDRDEAGRPRGAVADLVLSAADHARLTGTLRFDFGSTPVDPARDRLELLLIDEAKARRPLVGTSVVRGLAPGAWIWEVGGDGLGRRRGVAQLVAGAETLVALQAESPREATIRGTLTLDGAPAGDALIAVLLKPRRGHKDTSFEQRTSARSGAFQLTGVPPGTWGLTAHTTGALERVEAETIVTVAEGDVLDVDLPLERREMGFLYVNVREGGQPVGPTEIVHVEFWRPSGVLETARDMTIPEKLAHGGQRFRIPMGEYVLRVALPDGRSRTRRVEVTEPFNMGLVLSLTPKQIDAYEVLIGFQERAADSEK